MTGAPRKYDDAQLIERVASCELARELRREKPNKELSYREATWGLTGDPKDSTSPRGAAIVRLRKLREAIDAAKADILRNSSALTVLPPSLINTADDPEMLTKKTGQNAAREMVLPTWQPSCGPSLTIWKAGGCRTLRKYGMPSQTLWG